MPVLDLTPEQLDPPVEASKFKRRNGIVVRRNPADIDAVVIHQTAVEFGATQAAIRAANGNKQLAVHRRALRVAAHVTAFKTGVAVQSCPLEWYVFNANDLNRRILGLEIEGLYSGLEASRSPDMNKFEGAVIEAAKDGLKLLVEKGRAAGMPIRYIYAHRQSSDMRRSDPGEAIWKAVVLEYGVKFLGLVTQPKFTIGEGSRPIPLEWDPAGVGSY